MRDLVKILSVLALALVLLALGWLKFTDTGQRFAMCHLSSQERQAEIVDATADLDSITGANATEDLVERNSVLGCEFGGD